MISSSNLHEEEPAVFLHEHVSFVVNFSKILISCGEEIEKSWRRDGEEMEKRWRRDGEEMEKRWRGDGEEIE